MSRGFAQLQDVIAEAEFPELDLALRRGRHVDREDGAWYALLTDAQELLEAFYRRYGCELIYKSDGYYYLLPVSEQLPRRHLAVTDMLVGQAMALLYLDPASVERGGLVTKEQVLEQLVTAMGSDALIRAFLPKRKRYDERVAQKQVRGKLAEAIRRLAGLGFAEVVEEEQLRLRPALLRFAEPVRGLAEPAEALARLVAQGEVALAEEGEEGGEGGEGSEAGEGAGKRGRKRKAAEVDEGDGDAESESESDADGDGDPDGEDEGDGDSGSDPVPVAAPAVKSAPIAAAPASPIAAVPAAPAADAADEDKDKDEDEDDGAHNRYRDFDDEDDEDDPERET